MRRQRFFTAIASYLLLFGLVRPGSSGETSETRPWKEYRTILWIGDTAYKQPSKLPLFFQRLREMGVNTAMVYGDGPLAPIVSNQFPYYVENVINRGLCLKFNSSVRDWDKFVTQWAAQGRGESELKRDYCLDDPAWMEWAVKEMKHVAEKNRPYQPLAYNIRDELSTTISANPFDYDFNPQALSKFREWLRTQYSDLSALNGEWETRYGTWEEVRPFTTDQSKARMAGGGSVPTSKPEWSELQHMKFAPATARRELSRWNFAPWADFRTYMDLSLARALEKIRTAAHEADPQTPVGIEGTQMPDAFGGYDLWRLSQVLDWVEPYDIGNAREIFGSFMAQRPIITTVFEGDTQHAQRRLWHLLLEGDRGCIVWWSEDCIDWKSPEYALTPKARALAPALKEMMSPLARLFLRARREYDPIYIHYSQTSIQVDWLMESTVDGPTWLRRFSSFEASHNRQIKVRNAWVKLLQDVGYSPQFISSEEIERGELAKRKAAAVVLPSSWAVSDREAEELQRFLSSDKGRVLLCDGVPGQFDGHGRLRSNSPAIFEPVCNGVSQTDCAILAEGRPPVIEHSDIARYAAERLEPSGNMGLQGWVSQSAHLPEPAVQVEGNGRVRVHRYEVSGGHLLAFERNVDYQMSEELKQAGGNEALEKPIEIEAKLKEPAEVYDLVSGKYLGRRSQFKFTLEPWHPSLFALTQVKLTGDAVAALNGGD